MEELPFSVLDLLIIGAYMLFALGVGFYFRRRASRSLEDFLLGGRSLPWYLAGLSMVATTFAADTPLWVTEKVAQYGVSGNWLWWNMLIGGMLTTFFFARYWRRAGITTELELLELRYSGKGAVILRGLKSVYLGAFLNLVVIAWVNRAMVVIVSVFFNIPEATALWWVFGMMLYVAVYSTLSGLLGIAVTDAVQFVIAMTGSIILAVVVVNQPEVGGLTGIRERLPEWRLNIFPSIGGAADAGIGTFSLSIGAFLSYFTLQWWASWYPGNEPGGGGYISQRMMSTRREEDAVYSSLFFQIAHYALRPWPWILVALGTLLLYPSLGVEDASSGYVMAMKDLLPSGLKGLLFAAFLSAYMSTISTQLNWGAGYLANDLYGRFVLRPSKNRQKILVRASRLFTLLLMLLSLPVTSSLNMIDSAAQFLISCGAGLGLILILRWYWWRINAWSEIAATLLPFLGMALGKFFFEPFFGDAFIAANGSFYITVALTTVGSISVALLTPPDEERTRQQFYDRVRPDGIWKLPDGMVKRFSFIRVLAWLLAVIMTYSVLFGTGALLIGTIQQAIIWWASAIVSGVLFVRTFRKSEREY